MAGASFDVEFNKLAAQDALNRYAKEMGDISPLLADIGEYLLRSDRQRFKSQISPDGTPWKPLSPRYLKTKQKNKNRILAFNGYLENNRRYQIANNELRFGSNEPYAAIHQFGGEINVAARMRTLYFKRDKDGGVGNRFVKKKNSDFAQDAQSKAYKIKIPARPHLGISEADNLEILNIVIDRLEG